MMERGQEALVDAKQSCLKKITQRIPIVEDYELEDHSDEEWYPPTPPIYDVTDKLR